MTFEEMEKQTIQLADAILRLCNAADNEDVVINALLASLTRTAQANQISPRTLLKICHLYLHVQSSEEAQRYMQKYFHDNIDAPHNQDLTYRNTDSPPAQGIDFSKLLKNLLESLKPSGKDT